MMIIKIIIIIINNIIVGIIIIVGIRLKRDGYCCCLWHNGCSWLLLLVMWRLATSCCSTSNDRQQQGSSSTDCVVFFFLNWGQSWDYWLCWGVKLSLLKMRDWFPHPWESISHFLFLNLGRLYNFDFNIHSFYKVNVINNFHSGFSFPNLKIKHTISVIYIMVVSWSKNFGSIWNA